MKDKENLFYKEFGKIVREARLKRTRVSQARLARWAKTTELTVSRIENGKPTKFHTSKKLIDTLKLDISKLL